MRNVVIIQARMSSVRLPGKVLKTVMGKPLLGYLLERLERCQLVDAIMIATTTNGGDDPIVELAQDAGVEVYRGDEHDVLSRYYQAAGTASADTIIRVTSDCPLHDPAVIDLAIETFHRGGDLSYLSNSRLRTYPRGLDTEVFCFSALEHAWKNATQSYEREHVTPYILEHPEMFALGDFISGREGLAAHRWTVDEQADFDLVQHIIEAIYPVNPEFAMDDVLTLLERHPDWMQINAHINQKVTKE